MSELLNELGILCMKCLLGILIAVFLLGGVHVLLFDIGTVIPTLLAQSAIYLAFIGVGSIIMSAVL